ncbi:nuclear transport factor 2 family protein [Mycolicibacterium sp. CBM1]
MTTVESVNIAATRAIYAAVPAGDLDTALLHMDPDIRITYYGSAAIPYAGDYRGIEAATEFFGTVGTHIEIVAMEPWLFIADGDNLAVWGHQTFLRPATGRTWESEFAHIITLRDGRWLHFRDFMNSALTHEVFTDGLG